MIKRFYKGNFGLTRTFWIFGFIIWILLWALVVHSLKYSAFLNNPILLICISLFIFLIYTAFIPIVIWKSANIFNGKKVWARLAKMYAVLMYATLMLPVLSHLIPLVYNPNTSPAISKLHPTPEMPFIGFWKVSSFNRYGIIIDSAENELYSVSFCGPGGCFEPGEWAPNTMLINDPRYRIIDENTIELTCDNNATIYKRITKGPYENN